MTKSKLINMLFIVGVTSVMFTGCSLKNPFGIGYDRSACDDAKSFGVCGSPKNILKYKDIVRSVQKRYFYAALDQQLFFAVNEKGKMLVKEDRDGSWEPYDLSDWKKLIDKRIADLRAREAAMEGGSGAVTLGKTDLSGLSSDIPVTKESDLSIVYQKQGILIETRTKVGNIIRDNGLIQPALISSYVDKGNTLNAAHEIYVVVREPEWIVGEQTPRNVEIGVIPTPISTELLKKQNRTEYYQEDVIRTYNADDKAGVIKAVHANPEFREKEYKHDMNVINSFLKDEEGK